MAQKMDNDETELKVPENRPICTPPPPIPSPSLQIPSTRSPDASDARSGSSSPPPAADGHGGEKEKKVKRVAMKRPREATRCSGPGCRKRVGLIGFRCRCGDVFCAEHRYSDRHDCSYDYKAAGREAITRENPVVRAPKLLKV